MPVPNPEYKPDWETLYDFHHAEKERIEKEEAVLLARRKELYESGATYHTPEMQDLYQQSSDLKDEGDRHLQICLRCQDTYQHATIQDAAKWLFEGFDFNWNVPGAQVLHCVDYEAFQTLEDVQKAWVEANEVSAQRKADKIHALKPGKPNGLDIFSPTGNNIISSSWQNFYESIESPHSNLSNRWRCHTYVTIDQRPDVYHICFMHDPDQIRGGRTPINCIEDISTEMYYRILELHEQEKKSNTISHEKHSFIKGMLSSLMKSANLFGGDPPMPRPEQFRFYVHVGPTPHFPEMFSFVDMSFDGKQFHSPQFKRFNTIPEILQSAYSKGAMRTVMSVEPLHLEAK